MYGDPDQVRALARQVQACADDLRADARSTEALQSVGWESTGANQWRDDVADLAVGMRADAAECDQVADLLLEHARQVEATLARIESAANRFWGQVESARSALANAGDEVVDTGLDWARGLVDQARRAPSVLSMDWLLW